MTDPLVVRTSDLAPWVRAFVEDFNRDHPKQVSVHFGPKFLDEGRERSRVESMIGGMGGVGYLVFKMRGSVLEEERVTKLTEYAQLQRVMSEESKYTSFAIADSILTAMGRVDLLHTAVQVLPNPRWALDRWVAWKEREGGCV